jgi:hypothetical protein
MQMKILSKIWDFFVGIGESVAEARMKQAEYYRKNHRGWE